MSVRLQNSRDTIQAEIAFPATKGQVIDQLGQLDLEDPNSTGSNSTVADILEPIDEEYEYHSDDELADDLCLLVGAEFVGRRFYDDRAPNVHEYEHLSF